MNIQKEKMISQKEFLKRYNIPESEFQSSGFNWEDLCKIFEDFTSEETQGKLQNVMKEFFSDYINSSRDTGLHTFHGRIKDGEHLIAKIIRKRFDNYKKYKMIDVDNYQKIVTDLIGIRGLVLFKEDWLTFHKYLMDKMENDSSFYVEDNYLEKFDGDSGHCYIAEAPKVHMRAGDSKELYRNWISEDNIKLKQNYRSVHYIIKYQGIYIEVQVRTLFEEGWSEIDHRLRYPYSMKCNLRKEYTALLSRLVGLADEMGTFFRILPEDLPETEAQEEQTHLTNFSLSVCHNTDEVQKMPSTAYECVENILKS